MSQPPDSHTPPEVSDSHPEVAAMDQGLDTTAKSSNVSSQNGSQEKLTKGLTKGRKRGNQGNFSGVYLKRLEENSAAYVAIEKKRAQTLWRTEFISSWFKEWPWHTNGVPEEFEIIEPIPKPSATDPFAVELVSFESTGLSREAYDELVSRRDNERAKRQEDGRQKSSSNASVFSGLLKQICNVGRPPRLTEPYKYYMSQPEYKDRVAEIYESRWKKADLDPKYRLWFHTQVAKEVFEGESAELRERIETEAKREHEKDLAAYKQLMNGDKIAITKLEEFGDLAKEIARENLVKYVGPLLDALGVLTGMPLTMIGGIPPRAGGEPDEFTCLTFSAEWWVWWATINPDWRERDVRNGRLRASTDEPKEKERWDVMRRPGQCGMLTVVLCLYHWFNKLNEEGEDEETKDWAAALADVIWVVQSMNQLFGKGKRGKKRKNSVEVVPEGRVLRARR
ncbi:hypothetical protein K435DRAFT_866935 [Dendrothele bispora CBS 962.96]|uniref:Uncharacterized protein n=1 Tax=Dendrothele bispora (strain CBS 962.96) TaxID=1314807 RepID=A0A4V4HDP5_DENBC|nr:hypothetical protein K435DRAFT_866935 [Dendrothele bispora CBS 962.96]